MEAARGVGVNHAILFIQEIAEQQNLALLLGGVRCY